MDQPPRRDTGSPAAGAKYIAPAAGFAIRTAISHRIALPACLLADRNWTTDMDYRIRPGPDAQTAAIIEPATRSPPTDESGTVKPLQERGRDGTSYFLTTGHTVLADYEGDRLTLDWSMDAPHVTVRPTTETDHERLRLYRLNITRNAPQYSLADAIEDRLGIPLSEVYDGELSRVWVTADWFYFDRALYRSPAELRLPDLLLALAGLDTEALYGLAEHPDCENAWYLCPPTDSEWQVAVQSMPNGGIRARTRTPGPFPSDVERVHVTYAPGPDTIVLYSEATSPVTDAWIGKVKAAYEAAEDDTTAEAGAHGTQLAADGDQSDGSLEDDAGGDSVVSADD